MFRGPGLESRRRHGWWHSNYSLNRKSPFERLAEGEEGLTTRMTREPAPLSKLPHSDNGRILAPYIRPSTRQVFSITKLKRRSPVRDHDHYATAAILTIARDIYRNNGMKYHFLIYMSGLHQSIS
ncbi:hypothetical protein TNCV_1691831 [Trichonephila clavipes]|nr:hypothetical protein TNCV_1691831 [Trichonephila clavipes]